MADHPPVTSAVAVEDEIDRGLVWHCGDPLREQKAVANGRAVLALPNRDIITICGADRLTWLHSLTSQRFERLGDHDSVNALILDPNGRIEYVLHCVEAGETVWVWTEAGAGAKLVSWLTSMKFMMDVQVELRSDLALLWVGQQLEIPQIAHVIRPSEVGAGHECWVDRGALDDLVSGLIAEGAQPVGTWAWDAIRIDQGVPRIGIDTDHKTIPNEIDLYGTELDKGCYRGQETVARVYNLGRPPRRLVRLHLDGTMVDLPQPGAEIATMAGKVVGRCGMAARHHELGPIALGLVKRAVDPGETLRIGDISASQELIVDPDVGLHVRPNLG